MTSEVKGNWASKDKFIALVHIQNQITIYIHVQGIPIINLIMFVLSRASHLISILATSSKGNTCKILHMTFWVKQRKIRVCKKEINAKNEPPITVNTFTTKIHDF